jgi:hypothetical protein
LSIDQVGKVCGVAGEYHAISETYCERSDDRIGCSNLACPPCCGSHEGRLACESFIDRADLAHPEELIFVKVTAVVTGQRFNQHNAWYLWRPRIAPPEFCQPGTLPGKCTRAAAVEYKFHAER